MRTVQSDLHSGVFESAVDRPLRLYGWTELIIIDIENTIKLKDFNI